MTKYFWDNEQAIMEFFLISICAFSTAFLSLFSGFGLGTVLMPVIAIFFPVPVAIAITAFVHLLNNIFKVIILRKHVSWKVTLRFGIPAVIAAFLGASVLSFLMQLPELYSYRIFHVHGSVEIVKIVPGVLLLIFATLGLSADKNIDLSTKWLPYGGLLSGFFGGLSGHQGAFRSPVLLRATHNKEQFVSTSASIAVLIDISRILIYSVAIYGFHTYKLNSLLVRTTVIAAFLGTSLGIFWLNKITYAAIHRFVAILLYVLGGLLIVGII